MIRYSSTLYMLLVLLGLTACTDHSIIDEVVEEATETTEADAPLLQLVDDEGNVADDLSPHWGSYYLQINATGPWHLEGQGGFVVPERTDGEGPALVPVLIGENWTTARTGALILTTQESSTRSAAVDSVETIIIHQMSNSNLNEVKRILSSNKGSGYGYSYNGDYCLGTTIEVFNMLMLDSMQQKMGYHFLEDDYYPHVEQSLVTGYSKEECANKLAIKASLGVEYNKVNVKVSGNFTSSSSSDGTTQYARSRINGTMFTREVHHYNILAVCREDTTGQLYKKLYAPGFRLVMEQLRNDLVNALGDAELKNIDTLKTDPICKTFCEEVGPCLITKSVMGCCLDYSMSIKSSALGDSMTCGGSLELKLKFATASIDVQADGQYTNQLSTIERNSEFECSVFGGEVMGVSILSSGGELSGNELSVWQQSILPSTAVMVDMRLAPIYSVIYDERVQEILREYITRRTS